MGHVVRMEENRGVQKWSSARVKLSREYICGGVPNVEVTEEIGNVENRSEWRA